MCSWKCDFIHFGAQVAHDPPACQLGNSSIAQTTIFGPIILIMAAMSVLNKRFVYLGASFICLHFKPIFYLYWGQALMFLFILGAMTFCHFGKWWKEHVFYRVITFFPQSVPPIYVKGWPIAPRVGTNTHKILGCATSLHIDTATQKTSQSLPPIYVKKSAQNSYIGGRLWLKIILFILVEHFGHFNVAWGWLWAKKRLKKGAETSHFKYRWQGTHRPSSGRAHKNLRPTAGGLIT